MVPSHPPDPNMGRPRAYSGEKRGSASDIMPERPLYTSLRNGGRPVSRARRTDGGQPPTSPLSNAERQARWRARRRVQQGTPVATQRLPLAHRRTRPPRWQATVAELLSLQAEYAAWLEALPDSLQDTATAEALQAIVELDLDALASTTPPRGYGRD